MRTEWRKSSHSDAEGQCVEAAARPEGVAVRDSKAPGTSLALAAETWRNLLTAIRSGGLDLP
nr:DUF397 domain-containing protein [Actinomadura bangladeshensis]